MTTTVGRPCTVCENPRRAEIEAALAGGVSIRGVAGKHGIGVSALHRHVHAHMALPAKPPAAIAPAPAPADAAAGASEPDPLVEARGLLGRDRYALLRARQEALASYQAARKRDGAPWRYLDARCRAFQQSMAGQEPARQLLISREAIKFFNQPPHAHAVAAAAHDEGERLTRLQAAAATVPAFNVGDFLARLSGRGIALRAGDGDEIVVTPARSLRDGERDLLKSHRAAVLHHLQTAESI
jgi:hypothetical protein